MPELAPTYVAGALVIGLLVAALVLAVWDDVARLVRYWQRAR